MKALKLYIFKYKGEDFSNGGISSKYNHILLINEHGTEEIDEQNPPDNLCKVVARRLFGSQLYLHVEPIKRPTGRGWMAGGCFVATSDSRFTDISSYPLSLHDRQEFDYDDYD